MSKPDFNSVRHHRWDRIPEEPLKGTITRRLITGDRMMLAHVYLKKGDDVPRHSHENEQLTYILEGALQFWIGANDERELTVRAGEVARDPVKRAAPGAGARGHARRRRVLPAAPGLVVGHRRLPAALNRKFAWILGCRGAGRW